MTQAIVLFLSVGHGNFNWVYGETREDSFQDIYQGGWIRPGILYVFILFYCNLYMSIMIWVRYQYVRYQGIKETCILYIHWWYCHTCRIFNVLGSSRQDSGSFYHVIVGIWVTGDTLWLENYVGIFCSLSIWGSNWATNNRGVRVQCQCRIQWVSSLKFPFAIILRRGRKSWFGGIPKGPRWSKLYELLRNTYSESGMSPFPRIFLGK